MTLPALGLLEGPAKSRVSMSLTFRLSARAPLRAGHADGGAHMQVEDRMAQAGDIVNQKADLDDAVAFRAHRRRVVRVGMPLLQVRPPVHEGLRLQAEPGRTTGGHVDQVGQLLHLIGLEGVVEVVRTGERIRVAHGHLRPLLGAAGLEHDDGLARVHGLRGGGGEGLDVLEALDVEADGADAGLVEERVEQLVVLAALPEGWHLRRVPDTAQAAVVGHAEWNHPGCAACDKARALHDRLQSRGKEPDR